MDAKIHRCFLVSVFAGLFLYVFASGLLGKESHEVCEPVPENGAGHVHCDINGVRFKPPCNALCMDPNAEPNLKGPFDFFVYFASEANEANLGEGATLVGSELNYNDPCELYFYVGEMAASSSWVWRVDFEDANGGGDPCFYEGPVYRFTKWGKAVLVSPKDGAEGVDAGQALLEWENDGFAASYNVYVYDGNSVVYSATGLTETNDVPNGLRMSSLYEWYVEEVNGLVTVESEHWTFMTAGCRTLDDMEAYNDSDNRIDEEGNWYGYPSNVDGGILSKLGTTNPYQGSQALKCEAGRARCEDPCSYDNFVEHEFAEVLDLTDDDGYSISIAYRADEVNSPDPCGMGDAIFIELEDGVGSTTKLYYPYEINDSNWAYWIVDIDDIATGGDTDVSSIKYVRLGLECTSDSGVATFYFDFLLRCSDICPAVRYSGDLTGDYVVDFRDIVVLVNDWLESDYYAGDYYVPVDSAANLYDEEEEGLRIVNAFDFSVLASQWGKSGGTFIDDDNDGLATCDELEIYRTSPFERDTDGDYHTDGEEVNPWHLEGTVLNEFTSFTDLSGADANSKNMEFYDPCTDGYRAVVSVPVSNMGVEMVTDFYIKLTGEELDGNYPQPYIVVGRDEPNVYPDWAFDRRGEAYLEGDTYVTAETLIGWGIQRVMELYARDEVINEGDEIQVPLYIYSGSKGRLAISELYIQTSVFETNPLRSDDHILLGKIQGVYDNNDTDGLAPKEGYQDAYGFREPMTGGITITNIETGDFMTTTADSSGFYIVNMADMPAGEANQTYSFNFDGVWTDSNSIQHDLTFNYDFSQAGMWFTHMQQTIGFEVDLEAVLIESSGPHQVPPTTENHYTTAGSTLKYNVCTARNSTISSTISDWTLNSRINTSNTLKTRYLQVKTPLEMNDAFTNEGKKKFWLDWSVQNVSCDECAISSTNKVRSKLYEPPKTIDKNDTDKDGGEMIPWVKFTIPTPAQLGESVEGKKMDIHLRGETHYYIEDGLSGYDSWKITVPIEVTFIK